MRILEKAEIDSGIPQPSKIANPYNEQTLKRLDEIRIEQGQISRTLGQAYNRYKELVDESIALLKNRESQK